MTNKLVVIINSLKVPKIKKLLLYEMKFLVPIYSCLQNPWLGDYVPRSPFSLSFLCPQLKLLKLPRKKFLGTPVIWEAEAAPIIFQRFQGCECTQKLQETLAVFFFINLAPSNAPQFQKNLNKMCFVVSCLTLVSPSMKNKKEIK